MNHTIKGIIIVVVIASMLFMGATSMFPIMQNSFAYKKSYFKGAERDPNTNTNTNTNTNSADSSSSSSATADNTNNINNTATASSNQNQNACAVAVTCSQGSTTVTPPTSIAGCPSGTLYDVTTQAAIGDIPAGTELCLPGDAAGNPTGLQTATIFQTTTTINVVVVGLKDPNAACPPGSIKAEVTSGQEHVPGLNAVCVSRTK